MEDVYEGHDGRTAVRALEGQLAGGQGRHQAAALVSAQAVVEFDRTCPTQTGLGSGVRRNTEGWRDAVGRYRDMPVRRAL